MTYSEDYEIMEPVPMAQVNPLFHEGEYEILNDEKEESPIVVPTKTMDSSPHHDHNETRFFDSPEFIHETTRSGTTLISLYKNIFY